MAKFMAASPKKSLALDTYLLLDFAGEKDFAREFKEEFSSRGYSLLVPPTVISFPFIHRIRNDC